MDKTTSKTRDVKHIPGTSQPYAVVIGLDSFTGLQSARILARRGVPVLGISEKPDHACAQTRVCRAKLAAGISDGAFVETLKHIAGTFNQPPVLYPCTDQAVLHISRQREQLQNSYRFALPDAETVELLIDKVRFYTFAMQEGFPIPRTHFLKNESEMEAVAEQMTYPCMMKPPLKSTAWMQRAEKVIKIHNADDLRRVYRQMQPYAEIIMIQQWVNGGDTALYSMNGYFDLSGQPQATFVARKIRQWPIETGVSSLGEEVRNDTVLNESLKLFKYVNYRGLGYIEMKRDVRSGHHYIIEPNIGRPTGRSAISEAGGVALLYTMYCDLTGQPLPEERFQTYGNAKWIYLRRDLQSAYAYWKSGELNFMEWVQSMRGRKWYAVFSWSDPRPFFQDIRDTFFKKVIMKSDDAKIKSRQRPKTVARPSSAEIT